MLIYALCNLVLQKMYRQKNPKLVKTTILASTLDIRVKCRPTAFFVDLEKKRRAADS